MQQYIDLTIDFANRNDRINGITLDRVTTRSYDTAIKFRIEIIGHVLDETYDVKILTKYHKSGLSVMTTLGDRLEIVDGKLIYTPKVNLITEADYVRNYLYLSKDGLGLDMAQFNYEVDVSQIGEVAVEVKQVYDESYETLITEFEQALEEYKLTLPQADSVRAEIDVILTQFGVDSQIKLSQYDTDAQQAIADNQTAFGLAESGRQDTYEQAEDERNRVSNQAVVDWEQGADALVDSKLIEIQTDASTMLNGAIDDFNQRGDAEIADWRVENSGELTALETEITKKANKQQEDWVTPTLLNGWSTHPVYGIVKYFKNSLGDIHIKGYLDGTNANSNHALTLPLNYRPDAPIYFLSDSIFSTSSFVRVMVRTDGNLNIPIGSRVAFYIIYRAEA